MSVVVEICKLVVPLCDYAQRIFEESDDNQEATNCWEVPIRTAVSACSDAAFVTPWLQMRNVPRRDSRLDGVGHGVQEVLNLVRLRPQLVQRTWVVPCIISSPSIAEWALVAKMVACGSTYLRHGCGGKVKERGRLGRGGCGFERASLGFWGSEALHSCERGLSRLPRNFNALNLAYPW